MTLAEAAEKIEEGAFVSVRIRISPDGQTCYLPVSSKVVLGIIGRDPDADDAEFAGEMDLDGDLIITSSN